eukprot:4558856-Amphidinium_carterae.1
MVALTLRGAAIGRPMKPSGIVPSQSNGLFQGDDISRFLTLWSRHNSIKVSLWRLIQSCFLYQQTAAMCILCRVVIFYSFCQLVDPGLELGRVRLTP